MKILWRIEKQAVRIMNDVPLEDHTPPRFAKPWFLEISISLVSEEHNYSTRSGIFSTFFLPHSKNNKEILSNCHWQILLE